MSRRLVSSISVTAILSGMSAAPATADWQFTHWGQTPEQLLEDPSRRLRKSTPKEVDNESIPLIPGEPLVAGEYATGDFTTDAWFYFRNNGLSGIRLELRTAAQANLAAARLELQYGVPVHSKEEEDKYCHEIEKRWVDAEHGNNVLFYYMDCDIDKLFVEQWYHIVYLPMISPEGSGL